MSDMMIMWQQRASSAEGKLDEAEATIRAIGDYNDTLLHEENCDARYNDDVADDEHEECNCSKGHIEALLNRSEG